MTQRWIYLLTGLALAVVSGCEKGPPSGPNLATPFTVHGTITLRGKTPLKGGIVYFSPKELTEGGKLRYEGAGLVDANGKYQIGLNGDGRGLGAGEYVVTMKPREVQELPNSNSAQIPKHYQEKADSPLTVTVKEEDNTFDFELQ
jgi:hypothetical protein